MDFIRERLTTGYSENDVCQGNKNWFGEWVEVSEGNATVGDESEEMIICTQL